MGVKQRSDGFSKSDLDELKAYRAPPAAVQDCLKCLVILVSGFQEKVFITKYEILDAQKDANLMKKLMDLDPKEIPELQKNWCRDLLGKYNEEGMSSYSKAVRPIYDWLLNVTCVYPFFPLITSADISCMIING